MKKTQNVKRSVSFNFVTLLCFDIPLFKTTYKVRRHFLRRNCPSLHLSKSLFKIITPLFKKGREGLELFFHEYFKARLDQRMTAFLRTTNNPHQRATTFKHSPYILFCMCILNQLTSKISKPWYKFTKNVTNVTEVCKYKKHSDNLAFKV